MPGAFDTFQNTFNTSMQLLLKKKAMDQEAQQFQAVMGQKKMELAQEAEQAKNKIAADEFSGKVKTIGTMLEKAHEFGDTKMVNWLAPRYEALSGIPQPKTQDGYLTLSKETDQLTLDKLTAQALQNNDLPLLERITNLKAAGATKVSNKTEVSLGDKGLTELVKNQAGQLVKEQASAEEAASGLQNIYEGKALLDKGIITGTGAELITSFGNFLSSRLGVNYEKDPIANTQAYAATMGNQVGRIIKQFGSGTGLSDADREYAEKIAGGKITITEGAIRKLLDINERMYKAQIEGYNKKAKKVIDRPGSGELLYSPMVDMPKKPEQKKATAPEMPPPAAHSGRIIKDTDTGKRYKSNGNEWVEVK